MPNWTLLEWIGVVGVLAAVLGTYFAWRALKNRKPDTTNIATGSERVEQSGGTGTTRNEAKDSKDVKQSG